MTIVPNTKIDTTQKYQVMADFYDQRGNKFFPRQEGWIGDSLSHLNTKILNNPRYILPLAETKWNGTTPIKVNLTAPPANQSPAAIPIAQPAPAPVATAPISSTAQAVPTPTVTETPVQVTPAPATPVASTPVVPPVTQTPVLQTPVVQTPVVAAPTPDAPVSTPATAAPAPTNTTAPTVSK